MARASIDRQVLVVWNELSKVRIVSCFIEMCLKGSGLIIFGNRCNVRVIKISSRYGFSQQGLPDLYFPIFLCSRYNKTLALYTKSPLPLPNLQTLCEVRFLKILVLASQSECTIWQFFCFCFVTNKKKWWTLYIIQYLCLHRRWPDLN